MNWVTIGIWTQATTNGLLIVTYTCTLVKVCRGTKYTTIIKISTLLLLANIAYLFNAAALVVFIKKENQDSPLKALIVWNNAVSGTWNLGDLFFCVSHWMLAVYYFNLAKNMPVVISHRGQDNPPIKDYKPLLRCGLIPNILFPVMEGVSEAWLAPLIFKKDDNAAL